MKILMMVYVLVFSTSLFAATDLKAIDVELEKLNVEKINVEKKVKQLEGFAKGYNGTITVMLENVDRTKGDYTQHRKARESLAAMERRLDPKLASLKKRIGASKTKLKSIRTQLKAAGSKRFSLKIAELNKKSKAAAEMKRQKEELRNINRRVEAVELDNDFSDSAVEVRDIETLMSGIEAKFDKMVVGKYIQEKFGRFVNSQLACNMVSRCSVTPEVKFNSQALEEVFPESGSSAIRDWYDKITKSGARGRAKAKRGIEKAGSN